MDAILGFFQSIVDFFAFLYDLIVSSINGSSVMFRMMESFVSDLPAYLSWLPDSVIAVFALGFSICMLQFFAKVGASIVGGNP
jgi:hypothetical protein